MSCPRFAHAATILTLGVTLGACGGPEESTAPDPQSLARPARIVTLTQQANVFKRSYPGTLEAIQQADLAFRIGGQLMELPAEAGRHVKRGELLARIDPKDYQNTLAEREARFELARIQLDQARKLLEKNVSSKLRYDQANAELKSAGAALQQARDNLGYTALTAPFDGVVARVNIENYQPVQAQVPIIQLRRESRLAIRFSVPESLIARLGYRQTADALNGFCGEVSFSTHPEQRYRACHKEHETIPDPLTRNYSALFQLDEVRDFVLLPGMTATIELDFSDFLAKQADDALYAPVEAIFSEEGKQWLWLVDAEMRARKLEVSVGRIEEGRVEILSGITAKSRIIATGTAYVREGMLVKPLVKQRGL